MGEVEILLRPTFENIANLESALGYGIPMLAFNLSKSKMPSLTDITKVIYFSQAEKAYKLDEIWQLVMAEGVSITTQVLEFVGKITAGDKFLSETTEKKT